MKFSPIVIGLCFVALVFSGKIFAFAQTMTAQVEPVLEIQGVTVKPGEIIADEPPVVAVADEEASAALLAREKAIEERELSLKALEAKVDHKVGELKTVKSTVDKLVRGVKELKTDDVKKLASMYGGMKPKDAASILNTLPAPLVLQIVDAMPSSAAGAVLGAMEPKMAREVTARILGRGDKLVSQ